jgi:beta-N-acetylhexosaminidase
VNAEASAPTPSASNLPQAQDGANGAPLQATVAGSAAFDGQAETHAAAAPISTPSSVSGTDPAPVEASQPEPADAPLRTAESEPPGAPHPAASAIAQQSPADAGGGAANSPAASVEIAAVQAATLPVPPAGVAAHLSERAAVGVAAAAATTQAVPLPPAGTGGNLDRMIGQLLIVGFKGVSPSEPSTQKLAAQIKAGLVGGVLFLSHNVQSPQQLRALTAYIQRLKTDIPLLLAVDQEGGMVQRLSPDKGFSEFPSAASLGRSNDPLMAYGVYRRLAAELAQYGFNMNLGPVVDLDRNDASPIIAGKERSYGAQPKHVAAFAKAFSMAHQELSVLTVLKHFPGHGSTPLDTHAQPVQLGSPWDAAELEPYRDLIASNEAQAIMTGHLAHPAITGDGGVPASLSVKAIRDTLRGSLGFGGVVISDDLEMGAIRDRFSIEDSAVRAIQAGNDIIIVSNQNAPSPDLPERLVAAIRAALEKGEISREALQASYDRILALKQRLQPLAAGKTGNGAKRASADKDRAQHR